MSFARFLLRCTSGAAFGVVCACVVWAIVADRDLRSER